MMNMTNSKRIAKEPQNQSQFDSYEKKPVVLGPYTSFMWRNDPKHLAFFLARYKFVSKLLTGKKEILEIGCGDAMGTPLVAVGADNVYSTDFEPLLIEDNKKRINEDYKNIHFSQLDITETPFEKVCNAAFALDVIEHIPPEKEYLFFENICKSLDKDAICVIGTPNVTAHSHASEVSKHGHVNMKSYQDHQALLARYFHNGILFSMNDEMVHTGYYPMAHYLIAVGIGPR
jgi:2-polyprenyl-3-methyl-5-hydroxy-6-metoxy-1,4-benzoquinol methylase